MAGAIKYIKFSEDYDTFDECKGKKKEISRNKESSSISQSSREYPNKKT